MTGSAMRRKATLSDLLAIPEEHRRHEIIDGELVEKEAAYGRHGAVQVRLGRRLGPYDRRSGGRSPGGWWVVVEVEVQFADSQIFRPDVAGWRRERLDVLPSDTLIRVAPDWVCEVLSTNRRNDLITKKRAYHHYQVRHYWIVDPVYETLAVYRWQPDDYVEVLVAGRGDDIRVEPFDAIEFRLGYLLGDDEAEDDF